MRPLALSFLAALALYLWRRIAIESAAKRHR